jgi:hypothetical protein
MAFLPNNLSLIGLGGIVGLPSSRNSGHGWLLGGDDEPACEKGSREALEVERP